MKSGLQGNLRVALGLACRLAVVLCVVSPTHAETATLEFEITDALNWRGDKAADIPTKVVETYSYDEKADVLTIEFRFDRKGFAPLPPMLALAAERGFPIELPPQVKPTGQVCPIGPLMGIENSDGYRCRIKGLGLYVLRRPRLGDGKVPEELLKELQSEIEKIIAVERPLAPWLVLVNVPGSGPDHRGDVYWHNPAETLYLLAEAAPVLEEKARGRLRKYLEDLRALEPPEKLRSVSFTEGVPREYCPHDRNLLKKWETDVLAYRVKGEGPIWSLYGLARYYELAGLKVDKDVMDRCSVIVSKGLEHRDWATMYWMRGHSPEFNAVHAVNQLFAGSVGYIRLARLAGDAKAEAMGWGMLGRMAVLRYAMGKYTRFQHEHHMFSVEARYPGEIMGKPDADPSVKVQTDPNKYAIPKDPAWWVKADGGQWIGNLRTWSWTQPADDVRQVHRLDEQGVEVWEWAGVDCGGSGQKRQRGEKDYWYGRLAPYYLPFADMTPELGLFLADHLAAESRAYVQRVRENQPHWYAAYCEAVLSAEIGFMTPCNAHNLFMAEAWILGEKPQTLERYIDVPWLKQGDLFYIHKLTEAIKAYRGVTWPAGQRSAPVDPRP